MPGFRERTCSFADIAVFLAGADEHRPYILPFCFPESFQQIDGADDIYFRSELRTLPRKSHRALSSKVIYHIRRHLVKKGENILFFQYIQRMHAAFFVNLLIGQTGGADVPACSRKLLYEIASDEAGCSDYQCFQGMPPFFMCIISAAQRAFQVSFPH